MTTINMSSQQLKAFSRRMATERYADQILKRQAQRIGCTPEELGRKLSVDSWERLAPTCECGEPIPQKIAPGATLMIVCYRCAAQSFNENRGTL